MKTNSAPLQSFACLSATSFLCRLFPCLYNLPLIMPEATAQKKFSCPSCGGEAQWNPAKKLLICPFCGTTSPAQAELSATGQETIVEHDLVAALRGIPDTQRGWQADKTSVKCQSCQAISVFDATRVGQRCDFCGSTGARALRGNQGSVPPGKPAADENSRNPGARFHPPLVRQPLVRAEQAEARRAHRHGSKGFTFLTGRSTRRFTPIGPPRAAITIT